MDNKSEFAQYCNQPDVKKKMSSYGDYTYLQKQIENYTWIQCDNLDCQKWRQIETAEADKFGSEQWFCWMNSDSEHNTCTSPEEDYSFYDKLAKKLGYKYVMSHLSEGSLVWAKMTGYCKWPAIVSRDPVIKQYFLVDDDGHPWEYHVEYLGNKHSHGWINSSMLSLYGHKTDKKQQFQEHDKMKRRSRKSRNRIRYAKKLTENRELNKYKRSPVEEAIDEAESLLSLSSESRLKNCIFISAPSSQKNSVREERKSTEPGLSKYSYQNRKNLRQTEVYCKFCSHCGLTTKKEKKKTDKMKSCSKTVKKEDKESKDRKRESQVVPNIVEDSLLMDEKYIQMQETFDCAQLTMQNTMVDKSKEDKFSIDVEMYKRNEKAFDHDLYRFMKRNNLKPKARPVWQNVPIGLFQLFLAVFERGGYEQVCKKYQWTSVYKELTNCGHGSCGATARSYYKRNVYPYELYITGKDHENALPKAHHRKKKLNAVDDQKPKANVSEKEKKIVEELSFDMHFSDDSSEMDVILNDIERSTRNIFQLQEEIDETQRRLGIDVKFHDESPSFHYSPGVTESKSKLDFEVSPYVMQLVPDVEFSSDTSCHSDERLILELKALENEFDTVNEEIAILTSL